MATVNFQCGHCANLMAVSVENLGQQVRCPHCQQVVIAPQAQAAAAPVPAPAPVETVKEENPFGSIQDSEDIFHQRSDTEDALFGDEAPKLELPAPVDVPVHAEEPVRIEPPVVEPAVQAPAPIPIPVEPIAATPPPSTSYEHAASTNADTTTATHTGAEAKLPWMTNQVPSGPVESTAIGTQPAEGKVTKRVRSGGDGGATWFVPLVFIPLVLYAVLATAAAVYMYVVMKTAKKSFFEQIHDEGDTPGTRDRSGRVYNIRKKDAELPLPDVLKVKLGNTLTIGDVEVTPKRVERGRVRLLAEGAEDRPEESPYEALILRMHVRNLASDYAFTPLDNYFDRQWDKMEANVPLTFLEVGATKFFGGSAKWVSLRGNSATRDRRMWLEGRENFDKQGLLPGGEMDTYVATDGWDPRVQEVLFGLNEQDEMTRKPYTGKLLWRVRIRRGRVEYRGKEVSATAVFGVEFTAADIAPVRTSKSL